MNGIAAALQGRISEPEMRYTAGGQAVLQFSIVAFDAKAAPGAEPEWVKVSVWGERAEQLAPSLKKGTECYLEGRLKLNKWESNGEQRSGLALSAWTCQPMAQIGKKAPQRPTPAAIGRPVMPARADTREPVAAGAAGRPEPWPGAAG